MTIFLLRRVLQSVIVILLVTVMTFALLRAIPGNPAIAILGPNSFRNPAAIRAFDRQYGFDLPWYSQYWLWLRHLLAGNLGFSWKLNQSVASLLGTHLPKTIFLVGISTILALVLAVPIGVIQAVRRNKFVDHFFNGFSTVFYAMPAFLLGILLILIFAIKIPIFPPEGPQGEGLGVLFTNFNALILPIISLTLITLALFSRYMRSSVLDNLTEDYVRTAKAKGASERRVLIRHVLRNSLIPIATLLGLQPARHHRGRADHRVGVQLPGHGLPVLPGGAELGLPDLARNHYRRSRGNSRGVVARRHRVRGARPAR